MSVRSGLVLTCCLLGTWLGCAGRSESDLEPGVILVPVGGAAGNHGGSGGKAGASVQGGAFSSGESAGKSGVAGRAGTFGSGGASTGFGTGGAAAGGSEVGGTTTRGTGGAGGAVGTSGAGGTIARGGRGGGSGGRPRGGAGGSSGFGGVTVSTGGASQGGRGQAGSGPVAGGGGSGGEIIIPQAWYCQRTTYADGVCDCGCGAPDFDCPEGTIDECARCNTSGSCSAIEDTCPGRIDPMHTSACVPPPAGWTCSSLAYSNGHCDCGCGVPDPDCKDQTLASCESCNGGCSRDACPASIDPNDNSQCVVPALWSCDSFDYGDGVCSCGCGAPDIDCLSTDSSVCSDCPGDGCAPYDCSRISPTDNAHCTSAPPAWSCSARLYADGSQCDCGCGAPDPDCIALGSAACDHCDDAGSCSNQACPGTITSDQNWLCAAPTPPSTWTCSRYAYGDGTWCDCGCGAPDPDCATADPSACDDCGSCSGVCPVSVDPNDTAECAPVPPTWTCDPAKWGDFACDCGCGTLDLDCAGPYSYDCNRCPDEGCSGGICGHIDPTNNATCSIVPPSGWTCSVGFYDDGVCDCGCGALDLDCPSASVSDCDFCNSRGSCSSATCPGTISPTDNGQCTP